MPDFSCVANPPVAGVHETPQTWPGGELVAPRNAGCQTCRIASFKTRGPLRETHALESLGWRSLGLSGALLAVVLCWALPAFAATKRPGTIQLSNGESLQGLISLTPGEDLRLHIDGNQIRALDFERVREIRLAPALEKMVQKWRFLEAGQTRKELSGKPYLIRDLQATVVLAGGEKLAGHLYTTVFYVEEGEKARKVILPAKQRGKEGENANALIFPTFIRFTDAAAGAEETIRLRLGLPGLSDSTEMAALTWGALYTLDGRKTGTPGEFIMPSPLGREMFLAVKTANQILAGWPAASDPRFLEIVRTNLVNAEDFFDDRKLLGVCYDEPNLDIYSLLLLGRSGQTTMDGDKTQPWRLVILRWKYDPETERVLLAGRGCLFRGILPKGAALPAVSLSSGLWKPRKQGDLWVAGP
jgi:hypothetical protein